MDRNVETVHLADSLKLEDKEFDTNSTYILTLRAIIHNFQYVVVT